MIEIMREGNEQVLGVRATEKLTVADYRDVLAPQVRSLLGRFETLNVLFLIDEPFRGWSLGAAWANTAFDVKHRKDFAKVAIVGAPTWEQWCVKVAAAFVMAGELRTYDRDQEPAAWQWLRE
jgi:SpoIIAA-like